MASSAIRAQGATLRISTASAAADTITGITAANPPVVTASAHGMANGTVVVITGVVGMTEVNDRAFVVANQATNTFELKGVDGTGYTAYASGGSAVAQTMTLVANVRSVNLFNGTTPELEKTNLSSIAKEYDLDLADRGTGSVNLDIDPTDPGQVAMKAANLAGTTKAYSVTLRTGAAAAFMALVTSNPADIPAGGHVNAAIGLRHTGLEAWFA